MTGIINFLQSIIQFDGLINTVLTGLFTFLVTKYTYHKNIPLDKMEISYNRIYYPIYRMLKSCKDVEEKVEICDSYLSKYDKYVDRSTLRAFQYLQDSIGGKDEKRAYANFESNIYANNVKLRTRLGYLEPNVFTMYTYSNPSDKRIFRMALETIVLYTAIIITNYVGKEIEKFCVIVSLLVFLLILIELVLLIISKIRSKICIIKKCKR